MKQRSIAICLAVLTLLMTISEVRADNRVTVFAAASLRGALDELVQQFEAQVVIAYGGSSAIARQVSQGAPADLVILANSDWDNWLSKQNISTNSLVPALLTNTLILIGNANQTAFSQRPNAKDIVNGLNGGRLAMGQRDGVPAGQYAKAWLEFHGMWTDLEPHLAETQNVRIALAMVHRGEAPLGVVYASDVQASDAIKVLWEIDPNTHPAIHYPARALTPKGSELLNFLKTPDAQRVFTEFGFIPGTMVAQ